MSECKYIKNFIINTNLNEINNIFNCNCDYCNYSEFDNYVSKIKRINSNNIEYNNINLIWTKTMLFIKEYLFIFENYL